MVTLNLTDSNQLKSRVLADRNNSFSNATPVLMQDQSLLQERANSNLRVKKNQKVDVR